MEPRVTIVSSSDDRYAPLLLELIESIRAHPQSASVDISVISAGMSDRYARRVAEAADNFAEGRWHLPLSKRRFRGREYLKARIVKLFLPEYFQDYDIYIWLDADCWVCDWRAIDLFVEGAARGSLAMVYDDNSSRGKLGGKISWLFGRYPIVKTYGYKHGMRALLPMATVRRLTMVRPLNGGAFALPAGAPHWDAVQRHMARLTKYGRIVGSNQLAFAMAVALDGLPIERLPEWCNYMDTPRVCARTGRLVTHYLPHSPVGVMHLCDRDDIRLDPSNEVELLDTRGRPVRRSLRYASGSVVPADGADPSGAAPYAGVG